jgi:hypothetical protein
MFRTSSSTSLTCFPDGSAAPIFKSWPFLAIHCRQTGRNTLLYLEKTKD